MANDAVLEIARGLIDRFSEGEMLAKSPRKRTPTFAEYLAEEADRFRKAAEDAPPGLPRELLLRRIQIAETAVKNGQLKSAALHGRRP